MKFGLMYANAGPLGSPELLTHLATTAERVGIESIWVVEHVVIPVGYKSTYPYDPSGRIPVPDQMPIPDPLLERQRPRIVLSGDLPSPINPPSGCRFSSRCPRATEICHKAEPALLDYGRDHRAACHHIPITPVATPR